MFFQNVFNQEFRGNWLVERHFSLTFKVPANRNTSQCMVCYNSGPFNLTGKTNLTINYCLHDEQKSFSALTINVSGATVGATTVTEVVDALNADDTFAQFFTADAYVNKYVRIQSNYKQDLRCYISNASAERVLRFNKYAGVAELPEYFDRHTIANWANFDDSAGMLIQLDESDATVDQPIITDAGFDYSAMLEDWELLAGRGGTEFVFKKQTVNGSDQVTQIIEYPAGAGVGDAAKKIKMTYTGTNVNPDTIAVIPYVLTSGDLITP